MRARKRKSGGHEDNKENDEEEEAGASTRPHTDNTQVDEEKEANVRRREQGRGKSHIDKRVQHTLPRMAKGPPRLCVLFSSLASVFLGPLAL